MLFKKQSLLQLMEGLEKNTFFILMNVQYFQHCSQICNTEYQSKNYHGKNGTPLKI